MKLLPRFLTTALLALALFSPGAFPPAAYAAVSKVTVTFYGAPATGRGFTWYTDASSLRSDLQVVEKAGPEPDFGKAASFSGRASASTNAPGEIVHKAEAAGLKPGTEYYYRVGDAALNAWSGIGAFRTAPESGPFTFVNLTDTQAKNEKESALSSATIAKAFNTLPHAAFLAITGDIVDTGAREKQWDWLLGEAAGSLMRTTLLPAAGNHEKQKNSFIEHFHLDTPPGADTRSGAYYSVDYLNAHFIVLNTNESSWTYSNLSRRQVNWLKADAAAARKRGAGWLIVMLHKGPYTTSTHATDREIRGFRGVRTRVAPLLARLGVDLVLQGHDHIYARTKPIKEDGTADSPVVTSGTLNGLGIEYASDPKGPIYLIPATAGAKTYYRNKKAGQNYYDLFAVADEHHAAAHGPDQKAPSRPLRGQVQNFTGITIDGSRLTAVSYEIDQSKNGAQPFIIDQFGIVKD